VEVALAAAEPPAGAAPPPGPGWSGWVRVAVGGEAAARLYLPTAEAARDLLLLARAVPGAMAPTVPVRIGELAATLARADLAVLAPREAAEPPPPETGAAPPAPAMLAPDAFEGTGFYDVERSGTAAWRWFGPDVTLVLRGVPPGAGRVTLLFSAVAKGVAPAAFSCSVNGLHVQARVTEIAKGRYRATLPVPEVTERPDRRVTLLLAFDGAHAPPGDMRLLTIACTGIEIGDA
jgi:hypothetical protein